MFLGKTKAVFSQGKVQVWLLEYHIIQLGKRLLNSKGIKRLKHQRPTAQLECVQGGAQVYTNDR